MENKKSKGEIISDNLIRLVLITMLVGGFCLIRPVFLTGVVMILTVGAYRFYHFHKKVRVLLAMGAILGKKNIKGEIISTYLFELGPIIVCIGVLVSAPLVIGTGFAMVLTGEAYRFYHSRRKSDKLRMYAMYVIILSIVLIIRYFQLF